MFTEKKFLSLPLRRQHKHAGNHLRLLYEKNLPITAQYRRMEKWLELLPLQEEKEEEIVNRFHLHMKNAMISLQESSFLWRQTDSLSKVPFGPLMIYLENLRSAFNIGSILRTTEAFRLGTVIFSENTPTADHLKVQKSAMGTALLVPTKRGGIDSLQRPLIALETVKEAPSLHSFSFPKTFSLLLGNEEYGLQRETLARVDSIVQIPLVGSKNSLNVASAFAIAAASIKNQLPSQ